MAYIPNVLRRNMPTTPILKDKPEAGDILSVSQLDIQGNFDYVQNAFDKDHIVAFGQDSSGGTPTQVLQGRHKQVSFNNRADDNLPLPAQTNGLLYTSIANLYFRGSGYANTVKLTNSNALPLSATPGRSFLPSPGNGGAGIVVQWGSKSPVAAGGITANVFTPAFSAVPYFVGITPVYTGANLDKDNPLQIKGVPTAAGFSVQNSTNGTNIASYYWIAIGPN